VHIQERGENVYVRLLPDTFRGQLEMSENDTLTIQFNSTSESIENGTTFAVFKKPSACNYAMGRINGTIGGEYVDLEKVYQQQPINPPPSPSSVETYFRFDQKCVLEWEPIPEYMGVEEIWIIETDLSGNETQSLIKGTYTHSAVLQSSTKNVSIIPKNACGSPVDVKTFIVDCQAKFGLVVREVRHGTLVRMVSVGNNTLAETDNMTATFNSISKPLEGRRQFAKFPSPPNCTHSSVRIHGNMNGTTVDFRTVFYPELSGPPPVPSDWHIVSDCPTLLNLVWTPAPAFAAVTKTFVLEKDINGFVSLTNIPDENKSSLQLKTGTHWVTVVTGNICGDNIPEMVTVDSLETIPFYRTQRYQDSLTAETP